MKKLLKETAMAEEENNELRQRHKNATDHDDNANTFANKKNIGSYFKDGVSKIDAVLSWKIEEEGDEKQADHEQMRLMFFKELEDEYRLKLEPSSEELQRCMNDEWDVDDGEDDENNDEDNGVVGGGGGEHDVEKETLKPKKKSPR